MMREDTTLLSNVPYSWFDLPNHTEKGFQPRPFGFIAPLFLNTAGSSAGPRMDLCPVAWAEIHSDQMLTDVIVSGRERLLSRRSGTEMQVGARVSGTFLPIVSALPDHLNSLRRPLKWWMSYGSTRNSIPPLPKNIQSLLTKAQSLRAEAITTSVELEVQ